LFLRKKSSQAQKSIDNRGGEWGSDRRPLA
jgi:hypothetical protein